MSLIFAKGETTELNSVKYCPFSLEISVKGGHAPLPSLLGQNCALERRGSVGYRDPERLLLSK